MKIIPPLLILVQADVDANDPFIVTEQDGKFLVDNALHGRSELNVHALHDYFRREIVGKVRHGLFVATARDGW